MESLCYNENMSEKQFQINLPPDCFYQEAKREYRTCLIMRLLIEFIQNSKDAMARSIQFSYDEDEKSLTVKDNGVGMDKEILLNGLLTYAGSVKENGAVGGFGAAKKILLFSHKGYEISTWELRVKGANINYSLSTVGEDDTIMGTIIKIYFGDWFSPSGQEIKNKLQIIANLSDIALKIFFNGEQITKKETESYLFERGLFKIHQRADKTNQVIVRFGGLYMFSCYAQTGNTIVFDCAAPSKDALSQNREAFASESQSNKEFQALISELTKNSSSGFAAAASVERTKSDTVSVENGILLRGYNGQNRLSKRQKMIWSLCEAARELVYSYVHFRMPTIHFYRDSQFNGICCEGKIWLNSDKFEGREGWEFKAIETYFHEVMHANGYDHDEQFISKFGQMWVIFLEKFSGLNPLKARMREIEKNTFRD